jgi:hypothetical protein
MPFSMHAPLRATRHRFPKIRSAHSRGERLEVEGGSARQSPPIWRSAPATVGGPLEALPRLTTRDREAQYDKAIEHRHPGLPREAREPAPPAGRAPRPRRAARLPGRLLHPLPLRGYQAVRRPQTGDSIRKPGRRGSLEPDDGRTDGRTTYLLGSQEARKGTDGRRLEFRSPILILRHVKPSPSRRKGDVRYERFLRRSPSGSWLPGFLI